MLDLNQKQRARSIYRVKTSFLPRQDIEITSWAGDAYGICARVGDVSEIERASPASEWDLWYKQRVWKPCPWSNLFISYILSEHFFFLFRKTSLYLEKMTSEFKKQGSAQTKCPKNTSFVGLYKCCELKYWQKIDQKWNTKLTQDCLRWLHDP